MVSAPWTRLVLGLPAEFWPPLLNSLVLVALLLALVFSGPVLTIPRSHLHAFIGAQQRAEKTLLEEFFCLTGKSGRVTGAVKPKQRAWIEYDEAGRPEWARVEYNRCPKGTIADFHTHPWGESRPSEPDRLTAALQDYDYHLIMYEIKPGTYGITAYSLKRYLKPGEVVFE